MYDTLHFLWGWEQELGKSCKSDGKGSELLLGEMDLNNGITWPQIGHNLRKKNFGKQECCIGSTTCL